MSREMLQVKQMTKKYGKTAALQDVSFSLMQGRIYGLIGQNGAGKTTLMRILCGFIECTEGSMELMGRHDPREIANARKKLGCMIESPGLIAHMNARENLRYQAILKGITDHTEEKRLLELTGLRNTGSKKVKDFSLGMKQRLGIALALLGGSELLILDEPINGLDPIGVKEIRRLLKKLCQEKNVTILISSHNLPELYQTATDYLIIHSGMVRKIISHEGLEVQLQYGNTPQDGETAGHDVTLEDYFISVIAE